MSGEVLPFILCGGAGTRLWPLSREAFPKQFHRLTGPQSLFQETCNRLSGGEFGKLSVLSNHQHRFLIQEQLQEIGLRADIALEPVSRNTAPAACVASLMAARSTPDALVLLAPSDHAIGEDASFAESVALGAEAARDGAVVTFGVKPDCPHTGYGYIEIDKVGPRRRRDEGEAVYREAIPRGGRELSRTRPLLLERRNLPLSRIDHA